MIPEEGINAIARLCIALNAIGIESKAINFMAQEIGEDPYATRIFGDCADEPSGKLKFNVGQDRSWRTVEQLSIDCRIPVTVSKEEIVWSPVTRGCPVWTGVQRVRLAGADLPALDHFMVTTLMNVYPKYSGDESPNPVLRAAQPMPGRSTTAWRSGRSFPVSR